VQVLLKKRKELLKPPTHPHTALSYLGGNSTSLPCRV